MVGHEDIDCIDYRGRISNNMQRPAILVILVMGVWEAKMKTTYNKYTVNVTIDPGSEMP